jgi:Immunoglobulin-like domain of bacterial spore germination/Sporulation and spore germination
MAGLAAFGMLWVLAGCAEPASEAAPPTGGRPATATTAAARPGAAVQQRGPHLRGRQLNLAVYYLRTFNGRRYLAPSGIDVDAGTATVELSRSALPAARAARRWPLQALVHTLTQFPTVRRVQVRVGGRPVAGPLSRDPALPLAPIALSEPAAGTLVRGDRLVVKGEASVFEGTVSLRLRDDRGQVMAQGYATAAEGAPGRGEFSAALTFTPPAASHLWTVEAFEVSAEDGRVLYLVKLPVWVGR